MFIQLYSLYIINIYNYNYIYFLHLINTIFYAAATDPKLYGLQSVS